MKASLSVLAGSILEAKPFGQRELGLVLVDDPRQVAHGRGRQPGLRDQQPFQPDRVESSSGTAGEADSMPVATVSSVMPGFLLTSAFARSIAFRVKPPRLAYCS